MKYRVIAVLMTALIFSSGCSMLNYEASKTDYVNRVATQRAQASGDANVVKAVAMGNTVAAGVDLADPAFWSVLKEHPMRALFAAALDVGAAAAATWAITATIDNSHHDSNAITVNGNNNTTSYNNGQGNNINNNPATTTTTDSHDTNP
jgi:hypothetical protein